TYEQVKDMLPQESDPGVITHENCPEQGSGEGGIITHENRPKQGLEEGAEPEKVLVMCGQPSQEELAELEQAKFLRFTSSQGLNVLLGIGQDDLPIFTLVGFGK
ncbi:MAG: hypothetical protein AB1801_23515, partial [Chloroflexota bacterium]